MAITQQSVKNIASSVNTIKEMEELLTLSLYAASLALLSLNWLNPNTKMTPGNLGWPLFRTLMDAVTDPAFSVPAGQSSYFGFPQRSLALDWGDLSTNNWVKIRSLMNLNCCACWDYD